MSSISPKRLAIAIDRVIAACKEGDLEGSLSKPLREKGMPIDGIVSYFKIDSPTPLPEADIRKAIEELTRLGILEEATVDGVEYVRDGDNWDRRNEVLSSEGF